MRPVLDYGSSVWEPPGVVLQEELESVQKRAARFVTGKTINLTTINFTVNQHLSVSSTDKDVINQENKTGNDLE